MKTSLLTGAALDWAVAQCEELNPMLSSSFEEGCVEGLAGYPFVYLHEPMKHNIAAPAFYTGYVPSASWWIGGAIIEREEITVEYAGVWLGRCWKDSDGEEQIQIEGETPLIAAMRCYVASKFGYEIEVPEELINYA